jgi:hypothetical protein
LNNNAGNTYFDDNIVTNNNFGFRLITTDNNVINNITIGSNSNFDFFMDSSATNNVVINSSFSSISILDGNSVLIIKNHLHIQVNDSQGLPIQNAEVQVEDGSTIVYSTSDYGGTSEKTNSRGQIKWILITDRIYNGSTTATENSTKLGVKFTGLLFRNNNRSVDMSESHFEFVSPNVLPSITNLNSPTNNSFVGTLKPELKWNLATDNENDPLTYYIQLDENNDDWSSLVTGFHTNVGIYSWNVTTNLIEGQTYQWRVCAHDGFGNGSWSKIQKFTVDTLAPEAPTAIVATPSSWTKNNSYSIGWTNPSDTSGIALGAYYKLNSAPTSTSDGTWISSKPITGITVPSDGVHTIYLWLKDNLGLMNHSNYGTTLLYFDGTPPDGPSVDSTTHNKNEWTKNSDPIFNWTAPSDLSGIAGYSYILDKEPLTIPDTNSEGVSTLKSFTNKVGGIWYFHIRAVDDVGNWGDTSHYQIRIDISGPSSAQANILIDGGADYSNDMDLNLQWQNFIDINGSGIEGYYYSFTNNGGTASGTWTTETNGNLTGVLEGEIKVYVWAKDKLGNIGSAASGSIIIKLPTVDDLELSKLSIYRTDEIIFTSNCQEAWDAESQLTCEFQYKHKSGLWQSLSSTYKFEIGGYWQSKYTSTIGTELGKYDVRVRYTNLNGSSTDWLMKSFTVLNNVPKIEMSVPVFYGVEDIDIVIDLSLYETDIEDSDSNLKWYVIYYMPTKITEITLIESPERQITFSPKADWSGSTNVNLSLMDSDDGITWKNITLIWESENDPPQVIGPIKDFSILEDQSDKSTVKLDTVFFDIDDISLSYSLSGNVHILVTINPDNSVIFIPETNWTGKETIKFTARDGKGLEISDEVDVTITPVNDKPIAFINTNIRSSILGKTFIIQGQGQDIDGSIDEYNWSVDSGAVTGSKSLFDTSSLTHGNHVIVLMVKDNDGAWSEPIEINFKITAHDLMIEDITFSKTEIIEGESITISVDIYNQGDANATNITIKFYDGDKEIGTKSVNKIGSADSETVSVNYQPSIGDHSIKVIISSENEDLLELDTDNNDISKSMKVNMDFTPWIILIMIVIIILIVVIVLFNRSRKMKKKESTAISEMEDELKQAKELGLPTEELEKLLEDAKGIRKRKK